MIKVFEVAEDEYVAAFTPESAAQYAKNMMGALAFEEITEEFGAPVELSEETMRRMLFTDQDTRQQMTFEERLAAELKAGMIAPFYFASGNL